MANFELILDRDKLDEVLAVNQEGIEDELNAEIGESDYEAIITKAASYTNHELTDVHIGYRNGWREEYEFLADAWSNFCFAVIRCAAEEVLGK